MYFNTILKFYLQTFFLFSTMIKNVKTSFVIPKRI